MRLSLQDRLLNKTVRNPLTGCWLFTGCIIKNSGYGQIGDGARGRLLAHRASYALFNGPIPEGLMVLHSCDVRACIKPTHLFVGTGKDNMQDAMRKGRHAAGERHALAKLTVAAVLSIREKLRDGFLAEEIATEFGIAASTVRDIKCGRRWRSVA